jgi:hypothetical protein
MPPIVAGGGYRPFLYVRAGGGAAARVNYSACCPMNSVGLTYFPSLSTS